MLNTFVVGGVGVVVGLGTRQCTRRTLICLLNDLCNKTTQRINTKAQHGVIDHHVLHNCYNIYIVLLCLQVFGLGNKTYEHYNKVAIYVDKRLEELGANRVFELGLGDDDAK